MTVIEMWELVDVAQLRYREALEQEHKDLYFTLKLLEFIANTEKHQNRYVFFKHTNSSPP